MVSKASELLPEPERPVTTVRELRGMRTLISRKLCWRAPRTDMCVIAMVGYQKTAAGTAKVLLATWISRTTLWGYSIWQQKCRSTLKRARELLRQSLRRLRETRSI